MQQQKLSTNPLPILFGFLILFPLFASAQDFRQSSWGDTQEEVIAAEGDRLASKTEDKIIFSTSLNGTTFVTGFDFVDGRLVGGSYFNLEEYSDPDSFITDYNTFKDLLVTKYGEPEFDDVTWLNDLHEDDRSRHGFAVSINHATYDARWTTDRTQIFTLLTGKNSIITHGILYTELESLEQREAAIEQQALDQL